MSRQWEDMVLPKELQLHVASPGGEERDSGNENIHCEYSQLTMRRHDITFVHKTLVKNILAKLFDHFCDPHQWQEVHKDTVQWLFKN